MTHSSPGPDGRTIDRSCWQGLDEAVQLYFELMYDCDLAHFDAVFRSTVQLHGFRDGAMVCWSAEAYRDVLRARTSPKSLGAPRLQEVLLVDFASPTQAFVKVRVRIVDSIFVDYLTWHFVDGRWLVTSKGFHLEATV